MPYPVVKSEDDNQVEWKSSAKQYAGFLAVLKGGVWVPISFDKIDYINCDHIEHHTAIATDKNFIGFNYKICAKTEKQDTYVTFDDHEVRTFELPEWYGEGTYQTRTMADAYTYDDTGQWLGTTSTNLKLIETSYALAKKTLPSVE